MIKIKKKREGNMKLISLFLCSIFLLVLGFLFFDSIQTENVVLSGFVDFFLNMIRAVFVPILDFLSKLFGGFLP